jgi:hypothetical protein
MSPSQARCAWWLADVTHLPTAARLTRPDGSLTPEELEACMLLMNKKKVCVLQGVWRGPAPRQEGGNMSVKQEPGHVK